MADRVDEILAQWAGARPDLDVSAMGVLGRLSRASRLVEKGLQTVFDHHHLQAGEFDILATLRRAGSPTGLTAGALAEAAMVTSGAITNRVDRLVAKKLVTREPDPANRRATLIDLTPAGRRLIDAALVDHVANEQRLLAALGTHRQTQLADLLRHLLESLGDAGPGDS